MEYFLMRKDEPITVCEMSDDGQMIDYAPNFKNPELAPLEMSAAENHIKRWWANRSVPLHQGRVEEMLKERGLMAPGDYLLKNLGLSLNDYYWIRPVDCDLKWKDVNLFENDFKDNILEPLIHDSSDSITYSPNSSLKGELEKSWIIKSGKRVLVKGNHGKSSMESINEVFAAELHHEQGYDNYTKYRLLKIKGKPYDYGCYCESFVDLNREYVSAHAVLTSEEKPKGKSTFQHFLDVAEKHGANRNELKNDLEYQILTDYLLSNVDRHMENIGILRDADNLQFIRMAPIFDTGRAFVAGSVTPYTDYEIDNIRVNSFRETEEELLELVSKDASLDLNKIPSSDTIYELYSKDSHMKEYQIQNIIKLYEEKAKRVKDSKRL